MLTRVVVLCQASRWAVIPQRLATIEHENLLCHHMPNRPFGRIHLFFLAVRQKNGRAGLQPLSMMLVPVGRIDQNQQNKKLTMR